jgi:polyhydroxyalkanoate synthesis regulator phasin
MIFLIWFKYNVLIMKTKTILELLTLSSSIYFLARDTHLMEKISEYSEKGKDNLNRMMSEPQLDENGNELQFVDKVILKTHEIKEELNQKIEEQVAKFYKKINIAHLDEIKALNEKIEKLDMTVALLEARLNKLETQ